jgi:hypothetical protein
MRKNDFLHRRSIMRFHEGLAWLMQISMFLVLGLLVFPSELITGHGTWVVDLGFPDPGARPLSVFLSLLPTKLNIREKTLISWVGLRGAAPIILATFPLVAGVTTQIPFSTWSFSSCSHLCCCKALLIIPVARLFRGLRSRPTITTALPARIHPGCQPRQRPGQFGDPSQLLAWSAKRSSICTT